MWRIGDRSASQYAICLQEKTKVPLRHFFGWLHACSTLPMSVLWYFELISRRCGGLATALPPNMRYVCKKKQKSLCVTSSSDSTPAPLCLCLLITSLYFLFRAFSLSLHCLTLCCNPRAARCGRSCRPLVTLPEQLHPTTHWKGPPLLRRSMSVCATFFNTLVTQILVGRTHLSSRVVTRILIWINPGSTQMWMR